MHKLSIFFITTSVLIIIFSGCGSEKLQKEPDNSENHSISKPVDRTTTVRERKKPELTDIYSKDPLKMYLYNKELTAQLELRNTFSRNPSRDNSKSLEERKIQDIRESFINGNFELAYRKGQDLLSNPNTSPQIKAEIYFMYADMNRQYSNETEALDFIGKAYDAMKEIHNQPDIIEKVSQHSILDQTINETNNFTPQEESEEEN